MAKWQDERIVSSVKGQIPDLAEHIRSTAYGKHCVNLSQRWLGMRLLWHLSIYMWTVALEHST